MLAYILDYVTGSDKECIQDIHSWLTCIIHMKSESLLNPNDTLKAKESKIDTKVHHLNTGLLVLILIFVKIIKTLLKKETNNLVPIVWDINYHARSLDTHS